MKKYFLLFAFALALIPASGQKKSPPLFEHVEPPFWWTSMKTRSLQILLHHSKVNIADYAVSLNYPGVTLAEVRKVENPHYLFVYLTLQTEVKPGSLPFVFTLGKKKFNFAYELKEKPVFLPKFRLWDLDLIIYNLLFYYPISKFF